MAKGRSPNYPGLTLVEAIERARKIYTEEHTHPAAKEIVAKALGYTTLNGTSLTVIGALRRYGLLEAAGDNLRVTDNAVAVLELPDSEAAYHAALQEIAFTPELFQELKAQFGANLPSEANLRHTLIKDGFMPKAADEVIRIYRENLKLVGFSNAEYDNPTGDVSPDRGQSMHLLTTGSSARADTPRQSQQVLPTVPTRSYFVDISIPRNVKAELRIIGDELKREDLERLKKQLLRLVENMDDAFSD